MKDKTMHETIIKFMGTFNTIQGLRDEIGTLETLLLIIHSVVLFTILDLHEEGLIGKEECDQFMDELL